MPIETTLCEAVERNGDVKSQEILIKAAFESGNPQYISHALGIIARVRGMTQLARDTGISRETLYRNLSKKGNPSLSTLTSVLSGLDLRIGVETSTLQQVARPRGRQGGRKLALTKAQVRMAQVAMANRDTSISELCKKLDVKPVTLYRYVDPEGNLRDYGKRVLDGA
ncbi:addiction module antidote protein [Sulfitobacter pontiacus]|uniref:addiction module antidote protein n=1 Tax=Sulfitobacter pontiacus TaxID=60137 RepID=UPI003BF5E643